MSLHDSNQMNRQILWRSVVTLVYLFIAFFTSIGFLTTFQAIRNHSENAFHSTRVTEERLVIGVQSKINALDVDSTDNADGSADWSPSSIVNSKRNASIIDDNSSRLSRTTGDRPINVLNVSNDDIPIRITHTNDRTSIDTDGLGLISDDALTQKKHETHETQENGSHPSLLTIQQMGLAFITFVSYSMIDFGVHWYRAALDAGIPREVIIVGALDTQVEERLHALHIPFLRLNETDDLDAQRKRYCGVHNCNNFRKMAPAKVHTHITPSHVCDLYVFLTQI